MTRIALLGFFGVENYGNQASLEVALATLRRRRPETELSCICFGTAEVAEAHGIPTESLYHPGPVGKLVSSSRNVRIATFPLLEIGRWIGAVRAARRLDGIVVPGTGILDDFGLRPNQLPLVLFRWAVAARLTKTPIVLVSIGAGPIRSRANRWLMTKFARAAQLRTYRDAGSAAFMTALGAPGEVAPDVVFAGQHTGSHAPPIDRPAEIGVGVMAYYGWSNDSSGGADTFDNYIDKMAQIVRRLLDQGDTVRLLIGESTDRLAVDAVLERSSTAGDDRVVVAPISAYGDVVEQTARTDATIVTRYHGLVASLLTARPTVSIEYARKNTELMSTVGLGEYCHEIDGFDVGAVLRDLDRVRTTWESHRPVVVQTIADWTTDVDELFDAAVKWVEDGRPAL